MQFVLGSYTFMLGSYKKWLPYDVYIRG